MDHDESSWVTDDGVRLYYQGWFPSGGETRGVILLVHGLGEHSGRYAHLGEFLTENGLAVHTFDLRGHGKSGGARGVTPSFERLMKDIDLLFAEADQRHPGLERILYGHSLGGVLVLNYALRRKPRLNGVVSASAALRTSVEEQPIKAILARLFGSLLPGLVLESGLDTSALSRNPDVVAAYENDPLVHSKISFGLGKGTLDAIAWAYEHASEFPAPLLMIHGTSDQLAYAHGSEQFAELVPKGCTLKLWEGLFHELHNEPERDKVLDYILAWIYDRLE
jgi:alpha-beta hydrolase superfamily lysophospholipase